MTTVASPSDHRASKGRPSSVSPSIAGAGTPTVSAEAWALPATETIPATTASPLQEGFDTRNGDYQGSEGRGWGASSSDGHGIGSTRTPSCPRTGTRQR